MTITDTIESFIGKSKFKFEKKREEKCFAYIANGASVGRLDDDVQIRIACYDDELLSVMFTFDKVDKETDVCYLLEGINEEAKLVCAYISNNGFFTLRAKCLTMTNPEDAENFLNAVFFETEALENSLEYITRLTK